MKKLSTLILTFVLAISASLFVACGIVDGSGSQQSEASSVSLSSSGENSSITDSIASDDSVSSDDSVTDSITSEDSTSSDSSSSSTGDQSGTDETPTQNTIAEVKAEIDKAPNGAEVVFSGVVVGFDSMGYAHVGDQTGIIYVRAKHENLVLGAFVKITGTGIVYTGSAAYPEYTRQIKEDNIIVESANGSAPSVKAAQVLSAAELLSISDSDKTKSFNGNLVTITGRVSVGATKYTYYLLDDNGVNMVGIHHYSKFFNNSVEDAQNAFNALDGKKITITGIVYRYYTKENIWTFQYVGENFDYTVVDESQGGGTQDEYCSVCGHQIVAGSDHSLRACGQHCNGFFSTLDHSMCIGCNGYMCDGADHNHTAVQTISQIKTLIDQNPDGISVDFKGVIIGEDALGYLHVADENGAIYVRADGADYNVYVGDYVRIQGKGHVYRGSATYPEYTRQISAASDYNPIQIEKLDSDPPFVISPQVLSESDLQTSSESADIGQSFHGNPVQITGTVSVGADKYTYYLLDDNGNKLVGIHHQSMQFNNSTEDYLNLFNALDGQKVTLNGVIYRYYTKENIWTFQYISQAAPAYESEWVTGGVEYGLSDDGTYVIAKTALYGDFRQEVEIVSEFNNLPVEEIAYGAFSQKPEIVRVKIPSSIKVIGDSAFSGCGYLKEVQIAENSQLTAIGDNAFENCKNLNTVGIAQNLKTIGYSAFSNAAISQITLPSGLQTVNSRAFEGCENLEKVYFAGSADDWAKIEFGENANPSIYTSEIYFNGPLVGNRLVLSSATTIGTRAFYNFNMVTEFVLPADLTDIANSAFEGCNSIVTMTMPCVETAMYNNGTNSHLGYIFGGDSKVPSTLKTVVVIGSTEVPEAYFRGCNSITSVTLSDGVTSIGESAFKACTALKDVTLPNSLAVIGWGAFEGCTSLKEISLPSSLVTIENSAFKSSGLTVVKIPFATKTIGNYAFYNCAGLKTIYIHSGMESVGLQTFDSPITTVYFTGEQTWDAFINKVGNIGTISDNATKTYVSTY